VKILSLAISGFVFVLSVIFGKNTNPSNMVNQLGVQTETTQEPLIRPTNTPVPNPTIKPTQNTIPTVIPTKKVTTSNSLGDFIYPGSLITNQSDATLALASGDNATIITEWYSSQLINNGFTALSSAKTNTNGNILNKVSGGKNGQQIEVTIKKTASSGSVNITVSKNNSTSSESSVHIEINNSQEDSQ